MVKWSSRMLAIEAKELSEKLIKTYNSELIPLLKEGFSKAGFTRNSLLSDPEKVFQMVVIAAYDKQPFYQAKLGYEDIWGIDRSPSVREILQEKGLLNLEKIRDLTTDDIKNILATLKFYDKDLHTDGDKVDYSRTIKEASEIITSEFHKKLLSANTPDSIRKVFLTFKSIHGIGDTIASKLLKYLLREIQIGKAKPSDFPLDVVAPLMDETHVKGAIREIEKIDQRIFPLTFGLLVAKGDPYAVDALFYFHRFKRQEFRGLIGMIKESSVSERIEKTLAEQKTRNFEKCEKMLEVIKEVYEDAHTVTDGELRKFGMSRQQLLGACRKLLVEMQELASKGDAVGMMEFYQRCLKSERGEVWDWVLPQLGKKCLKSEYERFKKIFEDFKRKLSKLR